MRGGGASPGLDPLLDAARERVGAYEAAADELRELLHERDLISLRCARLAGFLEAGGYAKGVGSETTVDWIRHQCKLAYGDAQELVTAGSQLEVLPVATRSVEKGRIGFGHLVQIARARRQLPAEVRLDEARLAEEAECISVSRFWYLCQAERRRLDAAGAAAEHRSLHERRALRMQRQPDGMVSISGILDPAGGEMVRAALRRLAQRAGRKDERTHDQRMADGLLDLVARRTRVQVHVTATMGTVMRIQHPEPGDLAGRLLPAETVQRMLCDGAVSRMIFSSESILLDAGRARRVVSPQTKRALVARDKHCRMPGCTKEGGWCEAHHVIPWAWGGATNLKNLVLLCTYHHTLLHEGNWQLLLRPDGTIEPVRPPPDWNRRRPWEAA